MTENSTSISPTTRRTKAMLLAENVKMRSALERCASGFTLKPADRDEIDWEGLAREFWRRMDIAGRALS